jgi:hypothetical protein
VYLEGTLLDKKIHLQMVDFFKRKMSILAGISYLKRLSSFSCFSHDKISWEKMKEKFL